MMNDGVITSKKKIYYTNFVLLLALTLSAFDNILRDSGVAGVGFFKNLILFIYILLAIEKIINKKVELTFIKELKSITLLTFIFFSLSCYYMFINGGIYLGTAESLMKLLLPCVAAFCIINTSSMIEIYGMIEKYLYISFALYILTVLLSGNLSLTTISNISIFDSWSNPFESNFFHHQPLHLLYFLHIMTKKELIYI